MKVRSIFIKEKYDVLVISAGGVGTTFMIDHISKFCKVNSKDNYDGIKHLPIPPVTDKETKIIYIYGNPKHAAISLFRRNYQYTQSYLIKKIFPNHTLLPFEMTLEDYCNQEHDGLYLNQHFKNWQGHYNNYSTLFIRYEKIHDNVDQIADFLAMPEIFISTFPPKKIRKSTTNNIDEGVNHKLDRIYENTELLKENRDLFYIKASTSNFSKLTSYTYVRLYVNEKLKQLKAKIKKRNVM